MSELWRLQFFVSSASWRSPRTINAACFRKICEARIAGYYPPSDGYCHLLVDGALVMCDGALAKRVLAAFKSLDKLTLGLIRNVLEVGVRFDIPEEEQVDIFEEAYVPPPVTDTHNNT
jgi:hypothetical protein